MEALLKPFIYFFSIDKACYFYLGNDEIKFQLYIRCHLQLIFSHTLATN